MLAQTVMLSLVLATAAPGGGSIAPAFVENLGQWSTETDFALSSGGWRLSVAGAALELAPGTPLQRNADRARGVRISVVGSPDAVAVGIQPRAGVVSYFRGQDPSGWVAGARRFDAVVARDVRPGVDLVVRWIGGTPTYDLELAAGADVTSIEMRCEGASNLDLLGDGSLRMDTKCGAWRQTPPRAFQTDAQGRRSAIMASFRVLSADRFTIEVSGRDTSRAAVIDPGIEWATWIGGSTAIPAPSGPCNVEEVHGLGIAANGDVVLAGWFCTADYPSTPGAYNSAQYDGTGDVFITRIKSDGTDLIYSAFIGGSTFDRTTESQLLEDGQVVVSGWTGSFDFPTTLGAAEPTKTTNSGVSFLACLNPEGTALQYSTYFGGAVQTGVQPRGMSVVVDSNGASVWLGGVLNSNNLPTTPGAFQASKPSPSGTSDGFLCRIDNSGKTLGYCTYLGGTLNSDTIETVLAMPDGTVIASGTTSNDDFPTTPGAFITPGWGAFVTRLEPTHSSLVFSAKLVGNSSDVPQALAHDRAGNIFVGGFTQSDTFPVTPGAFQSTCQTGLTCKDAFLAKLSPDGSSLLASTYFGLFGAEELGNITVDPAGSPTISGTTQSPFLWTTPGALYEDKFNPTFSQNDNFLTRFTPDLTKLVYSTYLGGSLGEDQGWSGCRHDVDTQGGVAVSAPSMSPDFPVTPGAYDTHLEQPGFDLYVIRFDAMPVGAEPFGKATPGCDGASYLEPMSQPAVGNLDFALRCVNAPPQKLGFLVVGTSALPGGLIASGLSLFVDPSHVVLAPVLSDTWGTVHVPASLSPAVVAPGLVAHLQCVFSDACGLDGFSASNAMTIIVQP